MSLARLKVSWKGASRELTSFTSLSRTSNLWCTSSCQNKSMPCHLLSSTKPKKVRYSGLSVRVSINELSYFQSHSEDNNKIKDIHFNWAKIPSFTRLRLRLKSLQSPFSRERTSSTVLIKWQSLSEILALSKLTLMHWVKDTSRTLTGNKYSGRMTKEMLD